MFMYLERIIDFTDMDIIFLRNYNNPQGNKLKEYNEDIESIRGLKKHVKKFYFKQNSLHFKRVLNNLIFISNIFREKNYFEVFSYIAYKYFYDENDRNILFDFYVNIIYYYFDIKIDENKIDRKYFEILKKFDN